MSFNSYFSSIAEYAKKSLPGIINKTSLSPGNCLSNASVGEQIGVLMRYATDLQANMARARALYYGIEPLISKFYDRDQYDELSEAVKNDDEILIERENYTITIDDEDDELEDICQAIADLNEVADEYSVSTLKGEVYSFKVETNAEIQQQLRNMKDAEQAYVGSTDILVIPGRPDHPEDEIIPVLTLSKQANQHAKILFNPIVVSVARDRVTSMFDVEAAIAKADSINTVVLETTNQLRGMKFSFSDLKAKVESVLPQYQGNTHSTVNSLLSDIGDVAFRGGIIGVIKYLIKLISKPATFIATSGSKLTFANNSDNVPAEYIAGVVCKIVGSAVSLIGAIVTFVSPYIGIALSLVGTVLTAIPQAISYDYQTATLYTYAGASNSVLSVAPHALAQWTFTPSSVDDPFYKLGTFIKDNGSCIYFEVPGGLIFAGMMTDSPAEIRVNVEFHPSLCDSLSLAYETMGSPNYEDANLVYEHQAAAGFTPHIYVFNPTIAQHTSGDFPYSGHFEMIMNNLDADGSEYCPYKGLASMTFYADSIMRYWRKAARPSMVFHYDGNTGEVDLATDAVTRIFIYGNVGLFMLWLAAGSTSATATNYPFDILMSSGSSASTLNNNLWLYTFSMFNTALSARVVLGFYLKRIAHDLGITEDRIQPDRMSQYLTPYLQATSASNNWGLRASSGDGSWAGLATGFTAAESLRALQLTLTRYIRELDGQGFTHTSFYYASDASSTFATNVFDNFNYLYQHPVDDIAPYTSCSILEDDLSFAVLTPKYNRATFWKWVYITTAAVVATTVIAATAAIKFKMFATKKRLANQAKVEQAWSDYVSDPSAANQKKYRKTCRKANNWAKIVGGTQFDNTNYWNSGVPEEPVADPSESEDSSFLSDYFNSTLTDESNDDADGLDNSLNDSKILKKIKLLIQGEDITE